jgi:hypothetical protein
MIPLADLKVGSYEKSEFLNRPFIPSDGGLKPALPKYLQLRIYEKTVNCQLPTVNWV